MSAEPPLSRFAGVNPKPRPTDTLIVPGFDLMADILVVLLNKREIFTVEPSPTQDGVWHVGVFMSGKTAVLEALQRMGY